MDLVHFPLHWCPDCLGELVALTVRQPALLRHGGYGATVRTVTVHCPACLWELETEREEERPKGPTDPGHPRRGSTT